jgi:3-oxoacyl-[acyl-carrier-protein] synthase II
MAAGAHAPTGRRVVVTGLGVVTALGCTVDEFWAKLTAGTSAIGPITKFDHSRISVHIAGEIHDFDATKFVDKRTARRMDDFSAFAAAAAIMARDDAGLQIEPEAERIGAVVASGIGGLTTFQAEVENMVAKGPDRVSPMLIPMIIPNMGAAHVSLELGTKGPLSSTCTACAAGSNAIGDAFEAIRRGDAVAMFAGGSEAPICTIGVSGFASLRALSTRNDAPTEASRPFDAGRDGFVMGEGAGMLLLEDLDHALARGATIHAEMVGYGMSSDAYHMTAPDESGKSQARAMINAMRQAGIGPGDIDYINAHGTSTLPGDIAETRAMKIALGDSAYTTAVSSTKSMIGHCLGASGAIEAAVAVLAIERGVIPPTLNLTDLDPECDLDYVPNVARETKVDVAASNSFGFGGHNVTLIFKRYEV